jgi:hypothetical protein
MRDEIAPSELDHTAEWSKLEEGAQDVAAAVWLRKELKRMDPLLDVIWAKRSAKALPYPERWYIVRWNELTVPAFWLITSDDPSRPYATPGPQHLEMMQRNDLHRRGVSVMEDLRRANDEKAKAKVKAKELRSEEFREKLLEKLNHVYDTSVRVPKAIPNA